MLTENGIQRMLLKEEGLDNVVVQVLDTSEMSPHTVKQGDNPRIKLVLSDGKYSYGTCITGAQLYERIQKNRELDNFAVISISFVRSQSQRKHLLVVVDYNVVSHPGRIMGDPVDIPSSAVDSEGRVNLDSLPVQSGNSRADQYPQQIPEPNRPVPPTRPGAYGGSNRADQLSRGAQPAADFHRNQGGPPTTCHPIASLTPYQNKWKIRARVSSKLPIKTWHNARGEGKLFSMVLLDESGEMRATAFQECVDKFYNTIQENGVYFISGGSIKPANKQYTSVKNDYELTLNQQTEITPCYDYNVHQLPTASFDFTKFDRLAALPNKTMVDVIGIMKSYGDIVNFTSRTKNQPLTKRDVTLVDETKNALNLTLWGETAQNFSQQKDCVLAVKGVSTSDFNGVSVSTGFSTEMHPNPDIREAHMLRGWYDKEGYRMEFTPLSTQQGVSSGRNDPPKCIAVADAENLGSGMEKGDWFTVYGSISFMNAATSLYQACPSDGNCNKKVVDQGNGMYRCEKCNQEWDHFKYRMLLQMQISDFTGAKYVTVFGDVGEQILGKSADELGKLKDENDEEFQAVFAEAMFKTYIFLVKAKTESYNDEQRVKWTLVKANPVDAVQHKGHLDDQIQKMERLN